jgi:hypothetical protein
MTDTVDPMVEESSSISPCGLCLADHKTTKQPQNNHKTTTKQPQNNHKTTTNNHKQPQNNHKYGNFQIFKPLLASLWFSQSRKKF